MRIARSFLACSHPLVTPRSPSARAILFLFRVSPRFPHFAFASRPRLLLPFVGSVSSLFASRRERFYSGIDLSYRLRTPASPPPSSSVTLSYTLFLSCIPRTSTRGKHTSPTTTSTKIRRPARPPSARRRRQGATLSRRRAYRCTRR